MYVIGDIVRITLPATMLDTVNRRDMQNKICIVRDIRTLFGTDNEGEPILYLERVDTGYTVTIRQGLVTLIHSEDNGSVPAGALDAWLSAR